MNYKRIFVSNRAGIGDVILTTPVLKALKIKYPDSKITLLVEANCIDVVKNLEFVDVVIPYNKKICNIWEIVKHVWRYDIALCLDFKYRTAVIAFLAAIPIRVGIRHKHKLFMSKSIERHAEWDSTYEPYNYAMIIKGTTGIDLLGEDLTKLYLPQIDAREVVCIDQLFLANNLPFGKDIITISPFSSWEPKDWSIENYLQLILKFSAYPVLVIGVEKDAVRAADLFKLDNVINLMGKTSLMQMAEVIKRSKLFIGSCSAALHMAGVYHIPFVAMYGLTKPKRWAPKTKGIAIDLELSCSPCKLGCKEKPCQTGILVDDVYRSCMNMLGE